MTCQYCGNPLDDNSNTCTVCGATNAISSGQASTTDIGTTQYQESAQQNYSTPSNSPHPINQEQQYTFYPQQPIDPNYTTTEGNQNYYSNEPNTNPIYHNYNTTDNNQGYYPNYNINENNQEANAPYPNYNTTANNQGYYPNNQGSNVHYPVMGQPASPVPVYTPPPQPIYVGPNTMPAKSRNKGIIAAIVVISLILALIAVLFILGSGSTSGKTSTDRTTNVIQATDSRGNSYLVNADGTYQKMSLDATNAYTSHSNDYTIWAVTGIEDFDIRNYDINNPRINYHSTLIQGDKQTDLDNAHSIFFSEDNKSLIYQSAASRNNLIYRYDIKTETSVEIASTRNYINQIVASPNLNIIYYTTSSDFSDTERFDLYKIVGNNEPELMSSKDIPVLVTNKGDYLGFSFDYKRDKYELIINSAGEATTVAKYKISTGSSIYSSYFFCNKDLSEILYYNSDEDGFYIYSAKTGKSEFLADTLSNIFIDGKALGFNYREFLQVNSFTDTNLIYVTDDVFLRFDSKGQVNEIAEYYDQIRVTSSNIFFIDHRDNLVSYNMSTDKTETIGEDVGFMNVSLDSKTIVYTTNEYDAYVYRNGKSELIQRDDIEWIDVSDDGNIVFMYDSNEDALYAYKDKNNIEELGTDLYNTPTVVGNSVFFDEGDDSLMISVNGEPSDNVLRRLESFKPTREDDLFKHYMSQ